jgi:SWI/SNF-related matrix-associated actin-dependent regulator of chromatin subfamily A containing DEAD/H box 1
MVLSGCTTYQAVATLKLRPFHNVDDFCSKLGQGVAVGALTRINSPLKDFRDITAIFSGYSIVADIVDECQQIGENLQHTMRSWPMNDFRKDDREVKNATDFIGLTNQADNIEIEVTTTATSFIVFQLSTLTKGYMLKDYQIYSVNWLNFFYARGWSCILADDMGAILHTCLNQQFSR